MGAGWSPEVTGVDFSPGLPLPSPREEGVSPAAQEAASGRPLPMKGVGRRGAGWGLPSCLLTPACPPHGAPSGEGYSSPLCPGKGVSEAVWCES